MAEEMYLKIAPIILKQLDDWKNDDWKPFEFFNIKPLFRVYVNLISITLVIFVFEFINRLINNFVDSLDFTSFLC